MAEISPYAIQRAFTALAEARARLLTVDPTIVDDQPAYIDTMDGMSQGDPLAVVDRLVEASIAAEHMAAAVAQRRKELGERQKRFENHQAWCRTTARDFMAGLEISKLQRPTYTASIGTSPGKVHVENVGDLPPEYQRVTIDADTTAIRAALKQGDEIPGASLGNGEPTITIRTK